MPSIDGCGRPSRLSADVVGPSPSTAGRADKARSTTTGGSVANTVTVLASRTTQPSRDTLELRRFREPSRFIILRGKTPTRIIGKDTRSHSTKKENDRTQKTDENLSVFVSYPQVPSARRPETPPGYRFGYPQHQRDSEAPQPCTQADMLLPNARSTVHIG